MGVTTPQTVLKSPLDAEGMSIQVQKAQGHAQQGADVEEWCKIKKAKCPIHNKKQR